MVKLLKIQSRFDAELRCTYHQEEVVKKWIRKHTPKWRFQKVLQMTLPGKHKQFSVPKCGLIMEILFIKVQTCMP